MLLTVLHPDFVLLVSTLRTKQIFNLHPCLLLQPIYEQLLCGDLMEDSLKGLTEVQIENIHCSSLIHILI